MVLGVLSFITLSYFVIFFVLIAMGIAAGYLLHWMISSISLEISILIGVFSVNSAMYFFSKILAALSHIQEEQDVKDNYVSRIRSRYLKKFKDSR